MKTLEKPAKAPKPVTPTDEKGWQHPPPGAGFPARAACQAKVTDSERASGEKLISAYRAQEEISAANDIDARSKRLPQLEGSSTWLLGGADPHEARKVRREIELCDHEAYLAAQGRLNELRWDAINLVRPILERLVKHFDAELVEYTIGAEDRLAVMGIRIFNEQVNIRGDRIQDFELSHDTLFQAMRVRREITRHKLENIDIGSSIGAAQWLTTSEQSVPFQW